MNREVKFRAWNKSMEKWVYFTLDELHGCSWDWEEFENWCQFTGLKDKKGKEIYCGDIIKNNGSWIYIVYWHKSAGAWDTKPIEKERQFTTTKPLFEQVEKWDCEVIGNIYQNSNLLAK